MENLEPEVKRKKTQQEQDEAALLIDEYVLKDFEEDDFLQEGPTVILGGQSVVANEDELLALKDIVNDEALMREFEHDPFENSFDEDNNCDDFINVSGNSAAWRVFANSLIWRKIVGLLNFQDKKCIRLVCRDFNTSLLANTDFIEKTVVEINPVQAQEHHFGTTAVQWKHFKIDAKVGRPANFKETQDKIQFDWFYPKLIDAETISLTSIDNESSIFLPVLCKIIEAPADLKLLAIHGSLLRLPKRTLYEYKRTTTKKLTVKLSEIFISNMKKLFEFHIFGFHSADISNQDFIDVIYKLCEMLTSLQVLKVDNIFPYRDSKSLLALSNLAETSKKSISSLKLNTSFVWIPSLTEGIISKIFPTMHTVQIRSENNGSQQDLIKFFKSQPPLEEIDLTVLSRFQNEIMDIIRQKNQNLKCLRIKTMGFHHSEEDMWNFLSTLKYFEEFELNFPGHANYPMDRCCASLSAILKSFRGPLKKIFIKGISQTTVPLTRDDFSQINPSNIVQLKLVNLGAALSDEIIQFICEHFQLLKHLDVSGNRNCTDYGFTGRDGPDGNSSPFSLRALKGLRTLGMCNCGRITNLTLIHAISFLELQYLDISSNNGITNDGTGLSAIIENNPSLEIIKTSRRICPFNVGPTEHFHDGVRTYNNIPISEFHRRFKGFLFGEETIDPDSIIPMEDLLPRVFFFDHFDDDSDSEASFIDPDSDYEDEGYDYDYYGYGYAD